VGIKVDVKWKVRVNKKEYGSVEEMPPDVREAYEKAKGTARTTATRIVFNGREYPSVEAMPPDLRQVFEKVMRGAETVEISSEVLSGAEFGGTVPGEGGKSVARSFDTPRPIEPESLLSLSPRTLIVGLALVILLMGLYYVITR
jgi:cobalamin biosynthesis Mg chelatase CobN